MWNFVQARRKLLIPFKSFFTDGWSLNRFLNHAWFTKICQRYSLENRFQSRNTLFFARLESLNNKSCKITDTWIIPEWLLSERSIRVDCSWLLYRESERQSVLLCEFSASAQLVSKRAKWILSHPAGIGIIWRCQIWTFEVSQHVHQYWDVLRRIQNVQWSRQ